MSLRASKSGIVETSKDFTSLKTYHKQCRIAARPVRLKCCINDVRNLHRSNNLRTFSLDKPHFSDSRNETGLDFPPLQAIPWKKELVNSVNLIGLVGKDPEIRYYDTGKVFAKSSLAVRNTSDFREPPSWFILEFWDEIAKITFHHVKKGNKVHVVGRLQVDMVNKKDEVCSTYVKVVVQKLNFIDLSKEKVGRKLASEDKIIKVENLWQAFFSSPEEWWDNRYNKQNSNSPDFKHRTSGEALWIESWKTPLWVKSKLKDLESEGSFEKRLAGQDSFPYMSSFDDHDFNGQIYLGP